MKNHPRNTSSLPIKTHRILPLLLLPLMAAAAVAEPIVQERLPIEVRAKQVKDLRYGMFICWSLSAFSGSEWTDPVGKDASYFKVTGCDTDQWARTAKEAGMGYILFLVKHHDGFCLWDTKTTEFKVTKSPLGIDVIKQLRASCDKYGIKLAIYFSEGDWTFPGAKGMKVTHGSGQAPELVRAQLQELCTQYGPVEFFWLDCAGGHAGLKHDEIVAWIKKFQPNCLVGANGGHPSEGFELRAGEIARPTQEPGFAVSEFTFPLLTEHAGGAKWFYSLPKHDHLCRSAEDIYGAWQLAVKNDLIFSANVGPNYEGKLREIDVKTLRQVGDWIRNPSQGPAPLPPALSSGKPVTASSVDPGYHARRWTPDATVDDNTSFVSYWVSHRDARDGWLAIDLGAPQTIGRVEIYERLNHSIQSFAIEILDGDVWKPVASGTTIGPKKVLDFPPVQARQVRLHVLKSSSHIVIEEFRILPPANR
ncbi:MAG: alpha-L-fucosidase [bacterium]